MDRLDNIVQFGYLTYYDARQRCQTMTGWFAYDIHKTKIIGRTSDLTTRLTTICPAACLVSFTKGPQDED